MTQSTETATTLREALNFVGGRVGRRERRRPRSTSPIRSPARRSFARPRARGTTRGARSRRLRTRSPRGLRRRPPCARAIFLRAADILESRRDEVVDLLARETGCTFGFGMFQMHFTPGLLRQAAGSAYAPSER